MIDARRIRSASLAVLALFLAPGCNHASDPATPLIPPNNTISYIPIAPSVFVDRATVQSWADTHNEVAVSAHALRLWNGLTRSTGQTFRGTRLAVFDTWYTACDIFPVTATCGNGVVHKPTTIMLLAPSQSSVRTQEVNGSDILSSVRYNQEMKDFVDAGYSGESYTGGGGLERAIADKVSDLTDSAAPSAMMLKPAYELFSATQPTVITYWAGPGLTIPPGSTTSPLVPDATTWLKVAVIDPTGNATNAQPVTFCANTIDSTGNVVSSANYTAAAGSYPVIPLSDFYTVPMTSDEVDLVRRNRDDLRERQQTRLARLGRSASVPGCPVTVPPNPVAALVAMHVVSAELHNVWTWQTFWWTPDATPLSVNNPQFRHFDFATAYWTVDTQPTGFRFAFNPYLETAFGTATFGTDYWPAQGQPGSTMNLGETTNCISCHQQATYNVSASPNPAPYYVAHGDQPQIVTPQSILTRNLWSLADRAAHP